MNGEFFSRISCELLVNHSSNFLFCVGVQNCFVFGFYKGTAIYTRRRAAKLKNLAMLTRGLCSGRA